MPTPLKILGLIAHKTDPSSRARLLQYIPHLNYLDIFVTPRFFNPHTNADPSKWMYKANKFSGINPWRFLWLQKTISRLPLFYSQYNYDIIWQNRMILPHQSFFEQKLSKPIIFDFDDAIWLHDGEKHVIKAIQNATQVFAGNEYLANFAVKYNNKIQIIPSVIDTAQLFPLKTETSFFTIGWIGSASNLKYLEPIKPAILDFLSQNPDTRFMVVSSDPGNLFQFDGNRILFKKWSPENENRLINEMNVGIMPLTDDEYTRGKCSYKMLQYMACGKPVVVSPVGMNLKILKESNAGFAAKENNKWKDAFSSLKNDQTLYKEHSVNGRNCVEEKYSLNKFTPVVAGLFRSL